MVTDYASSLQIKKENESAWRKWFESTTFRVFILVVLAVLGVLYIVQTSSISTKGYAISDLQKQVKILEQDNRALQVKVAENRSMNSIQSRLKGMNLVSALDVEYMMPTGNTVARR
jgi:cell division protein FtsL